MKTITYHVDDFIQELSRHERYIESHKRNDTPICFGVAEKTIFVDHIDNLELKLERRTFLYIVMDDIARQTNNELGCGCLFYME